MSTEFVQLCFEAGSLGQMYVQIAWCGWTEPMQAIYTCLAPPPPWCMSGSHARAMQGKLMKPYAACAVVSIKRRNEGTVPLLQLVAKVLAGT